MEVGGRGGDGDEVECAWVVRGEFVEPIRIRSEVRRLTYITSITFITSITYDLPS
jgi:hypothetical protein